jgi:phosphoserine phosphatase RsbU/P
VARIDGERVTLASAGHPAPYLDGREVSLEAGLPLGIDAEAAYESWELRLATGQRLTFVSDGVVEAANARGELFGFERTAAISNHLAQEIADAAQSWGQNDDITVVTVRRMECPA